MEKINKKEVKETLPDSLTGDLFTGAVEMYCKIEGDTMELQSHSINSTDFVLGVSALFLKMLDHCPWSIRKEIMEMVVSHGQAKGLTVAEPSLYPDYKEDAKTEVKHES